MKKKSPTNLHWFEHTGRRQASFFIATGLIAVLFIAAVAGILNGRFKPFADINTGQQSPNLSQSATIEGGRLEFSNPDGSTSTVGGNSASLTANALTKAELKIPARGETVGQIPELNGVITIVTSGGTAQDNAVVRRLIWSTRDKKDSATAILTLNSDTFRQSLDRSNRAILDAIVKESNSLAVRVNGINPRDLGTIDFVRGDFNNDNTINGGDLAIFAADFDRAVDLQKATDLNGDGTVNGGDLAIFASSFGKEGVGY